MTPDEHDADDFATDDADAVDPSADEPDAESTQLPRVKICGHTTERDLRASVAAGANAVGVIADVSVDTPREVSVERAAELLEAVPPLATGVLVTMPESVGRAVELIGRTSPDAVQVHGTLAPDALAELRERVHVDVIAATDADDPDLGAYADAADALLVDTPADDGGGGTGETHDWVQTAEATADLDVLVLLAGGLTPENVADAIGAVRPDGVDVASGVEASRDESAGGEKDHEAVRAFVDAARQRRRVASTDGERGSHDPTRADDVAQPTEGSR